MAEIGASRRYVSRGMAIVAGLTLPLVVVATPAYAYSGAAAAQYANSDWNSINTQFNYFSGDDCTNFVSQSLYYGGYSMVFVPGWYGATNDDHYWYDSKPYNSNSWSVAADQRKFQNTHSPGGSTQGKATNVGPTFETDAYTPSSVVTGDEIFYDWQNNGSIDHMSIQVGIGTDPNSGWYGNFIDQHVTNRYHAFWSLYPYNSQWPTTVIYFEHISANNN